MIKLYTVNIRELSKSLESYYDRLKPDRIKRIKRFIKTDDKLRCAAAGLIIYEVYGNGNTDSFEISVNSCGKPYFKYLNKTNDLKEFNISHSGDWVIMASSDKPVGCDIEQCKESRDLLKLADAAFHREEIDFIRCRPDGELKDLFYTIWTLKESYVKLIGTGLYTSPKSFSVVRNNRLIKGFDFNGENYYYTTFDFHGYKLSTAANDIQEKAEILKF